MFFQIGVLKIFAKFTGKHLCCPLQAFFYKSRLLQTTYGGCFWIFAAANTFFSWLWYLLLTVTPNFAPNSFGNNELNVRSSHWNSSVKNVAFRNFASFTGKQLCWSLFLIKFQTFRPAALWKRDSNTSFPVEFPKLLRTPNLKSANACFWNLFFHLDCPF